MSSPSPSPTAVAGTMARSNADLDGPSRRLGTPRGTRQPHAPGGLDRAGGTAPTFGPGVGLRVRLGLEPGVLQRGEVDVDERAGQHLPGRRQLAQPVDERGVRAARVGEALDGLGERRERQGGGAGGLDRLDALPGRGSTTRGTARWRRRAAGPAGPRCRRRPRPRAAGSRRRRQVREVGDGARHGLAAGPAAGARRGRRPRLGRLTPPGPGVNPIWATPGDVVSASSACGATACSVPPSSPSSVSRNSARDPSSRARPGRAWRRPGPR